MLSIVIPTLNESAALPRTIPHTRHVARGYDIEIIVGDCRSDDGTADLAARLGARVIRGATCRADALNRGASLARGEVLLFLHADTLLPDHFAERIGRVLSDARVVGGAFDFKFGSHPQHRGLNRYSLMLVTCLNRIRCRWTKNFYGDQAIFVRRDAFQRAGRFPPVRLMEDLRFSRAMNRLGRTAILSPPVRTSPRRFIANGVIRQLMRDLALLTCESFSAQPKWLWRHYNRFNRDSRRVATFKTLQIHSRPAHPDPSMASTIQA